MDPRSGADRRALSLVHEALERRRERREGERRDSPRVPARFEVAFGLQRLSVEGSLGLGGASFETTAPVRGEVVRVEARLGPERLPFSSEARVAQRDRDGRKVSVQLVFGELEVGPALVLARFLDAQTRRAG